MIGLSGGWLLLTLVAVLVAVLVVVPDLIADRRMHRATMLYAVMSALALFAPSAALSYGLTGTATVVLATQAWPMTRAGAALLLAAAVATLGCAGVLFWQTSSEMAFYASMTALVLRCGLVGLHAGVSALCRSAPVLQAQQFATLLVLAVLHLRHVSNLPAAHDAAGLLILLGAVSALLFALISLVQRDLDGLLRSSMLMHGGLLLAALGAAARGHPVAALFVALTMTLALAGLSLTVLAIEARVGKVKWLNATGRARAFPRLAAAFGLFGAAGVGMPGTAGFIADDLVLHALWSESAAATIVVTLASALLAIATLRAIALTFMGPQTLSTAPDLTRVERGVVLALILLLFGIGLVPQAIVATSATLFGKPEVLSVPAHEVVTPR